MNELPAQGEECKGLDLAAVDLGGCDLSGREFIDCSFARATLTGASLEGTVFVDCDLCDANLESVRATSASFARVMFDDARFNGAVLEGARFEGGSIERVKFENARLQGVTLLDVRADMAQFEFAKLEAARIERSSLADCCFRGTNLEGASFVDVNLTHAAFEGIDIRGTSWRGVDLSLASFYEVDCSQAEFLNCRAFGVRVCRVRGTPARQERLNCGAHGEPDLLIDDFKLAPFLYEVDRDDAMGRLSETLAAKHVLLLGGFATESKRVLDELHRVFRAKGYISSIVDWECSGMLSASEVVRGIALSSRFVVADVTIARSVVVEVSEILGLRAVPVIPILAAGKREPETFVGLRRHYPQLLLPSYEYSSLESLTESIESGVIEPCEKVVSELFDSGGGTVETHALSRGGELR